jgi:hypothetical protein
MVLTVMENAYLRKAQEHPGFSEIHKKILFLLTHEKKYFTKDELFHIAKQKEIEKALTDLEELGIIKIEGWLVKLLPYTELFETTTKVH